jgi:hypothetical protein
MADFPGPSEAAKVLLSILPPKPYTYLSAFLPGLFFEVSIFLGNPQLIEQLNLRADHSAQLGKYPKICIAVFLAYVIGHALMLWVGFVHRILRVLYRLSWFLWRRFCVWPLLPALNYAISQRGWLSRRPWIFTSVIKPAEDAALNLDKESAGVRRLWATLARHLFGKQYGMDTIDHLQQEEWDALYEAARSSPIVELGGHVLMIASQALGWGALAAIRFAPQLATKTYYVFSLFLVAIGIMYEWWLVRRLGDETVIGLFRVRWLLEQLRKTHSMTGSKPSQDPGAEG